MVNGEEGCAAECGAPTFSILLMSFANDSADPGSSSTRSFGS